MLTAASLALMLTLIRQQRERQSWLSPIESLGGDVGTSAEGRYVTVRRRINDSDLRELCVHLKQLPRLYHIYIYGNVTDRGVAQLTQLKGLRELVRHVRGVVIPIGPAG
jgi:hypothetical protein